MDDWELVFYQAPSGRSPVQEFLDQLSVRDAARAQVELDLLQAYGLQLGMPHVRPLSGEIWELRIRGRLQHRVLYVAVSGRRMLLLHAFTKKTQQTPSREIRTAIDRLEDSRRRGTA